MNSIRRFLIWILLFTKRLYKKPSFIAILVLIPLVVVGYRFISQGESGMVTIVVCCEDPSDSFSTELRDQLVDSSDIIRFVTDKSPNEAERLVYEGAADAVWIIHKDLYDNIYQYVSGSYLGKGLVTVVVREETVPLMLTNEKLSSKLFVQCARLSFLNYFRVNAPEFGDFSDEEILSVFDKERFEDSLFSFSYVDSTVKVRELDYLLLPVRGMLAILILVSGFASSMYYISDERDGLFSALSFRKRAFTEMLYQMICIGNVTAFVMISLAVSGQLYNLFIEILSALLYVYCCAAFCSLLRLLCRDTRSVAMLLAVISLAMLLVCPVFISLPELKMPSLLFPPTYFINAGFNSEYLLYMMIFSAILSVLHFLFSRFFNK